MDTPRPVVDDDLIPFESEAAAVQAWINDCSVPCAGCHLRLDREATRWFHTDQPAGEPSHEARPIIHDPDQPPARQISDTDALDAITRILGAHRGWSSETAGEIQRYVLATGRPADRPGPDEIHQIDVPAWSWSPGRLVATHRHAHQPLAVQVWAEPLRTLLVLRSTSPKADYLGSMRYIDLLDPAGAEAAAQDLMKAHIGDVIERVLTSSD